ncbi:MAG: PQQ-binding-like beta-propeller repeat protein, partial [Planctomycetaceae bacterium]|nr:PQQ-binding-like beta-propeller repeat protein [Planctomycetaceae bacterium]
IRNLNDLKGRKLILGPKADAETNAAAVESLSDAKLEQHITMETAGSIESGVYAVSDGDVAATIITDYLPPLLEGCGKIAKGELRVIAKTKPVPFVEVFAVGHITDEEEQRLRNALEQVGRNADLLKFLESKTGFVSVAAEEIAKETERSPQSKLSDWTDWRGTGRDGQFAGLPQSFPQELNTLWTAKVTGPALAGIAATEEFVVVPDKDVGLMRDIFRCFNAKTGAELWTLEYPAETKLEYTNAPRANPVIHEGLVYLLGALGDLHCVELATGKVIWRKHFRKDFGAERPHWGWSSPPLVVEEKLIINPGAKDASLVALDRKTGKTLWQTPGHAAAYSALLLGTFSGVRQIVGYDVAELGGWDPKTGKRLWEVIPPRRSDFNVGTPLVLGNTLLVATENNATRVYSFDKTGKLNPQPTVVNEDLAPDTCSPVLSGDRVFCSGYGELFCLDRKQNFKTVWGELNDFFYDHTNIIAGNNRILVWTTGGDLLLIAADKDTYTQLAHIRPFGKRKVESTSHPALMKDRIYLRDSQELKCLSWKAKP